MFNGYRGVGRTVRGAVLAALLSWQAGSLNAGEIATTVTAYCPCSKCCGEWSAIGQRTASGTVPKAGRTIAATRHWKLGARVVVYGHTYIVEDRLSRRYKLPRIDIFMDSHTKAVRFGVKKLKL